MKRQPHAVELRPAAHYEIGELALLLNRAYADYYFPIWLDEARFLQMCREMDIDLQASVVATAGEPAGIAFLSRRARRGWVSGVGVLPFYRRRGIGSAMLRHLQQEARQLGLESLRLEVLVQNQGGLTLYRHLGFRWQRDLLTLSLEPEGFNAHPHALPDHFVPMESIRLLERHVALHDVPQPWVRELRSLRQGSETARTGLHGTGDRAGTPLPQSPSPGGADPGRPAPAPAAWTWGSPGWRRCPVGAL